MPLRQGAPESRMLAIGTRREGRKRIMKTRGSYWKLETRADMERAMNFGAGGAAFMVAATLVCIALGWFQPDAAVDALIAGVLAWFMVKRAHWAFGAMLGFYVFEVAAGL